MTNHFANTLKLIFAIVLLPLVIGVSVSFYLELKTIQRPLEENFFLGIFTFLLVYLFIYEPINIYRRGQRSVQIIFRFFSPLIKVASFCLPIYTILFLLVFLLTNLILKDNNYNNFVVFMVGFSFIFHLVFTARSLKSKESFFMYVNYLFFMELIYLFNIFLIAFSFNYLIDNFSFISFYHQTFAMAKEIYMTVIRQLFFIKS